MENKEQGYEYELIIDKAKKLLNHKKGQVPMERDMVAESRNKLRELHEDIDLLQHNNTFTVEHAFEGSAAKKQLHNSAKKVVSSALQPAMQQQTLYNENATKSLLNLTVLAQNLVDQTIRNKSYATSHIAYLQNDIGEVLQNMQRMEQKLDEVVRAGLGRTDNAKQSYAQAGEDLIIDAILQTLGLDYPQVTYLDVGAGYASECNNTYFAYLRGAHGVLVEANPRLVAPLRQQRESDVVLNYITDVNAGASTKLYVMNRGEISTTSLKHAQKLCELDAGLFIEEEVEVETADINQLLREHLGQAPTILSLNVEGGEAELLLTYDFGQYRPLIVVVELVQHGAGLVHTTKHPGVTQLLCGIGYEEFAFTGRQGIFIDASRGGGTA